MALILIPRFVALTGHARDLKVATSTITTMLAPGDTLGRITTDGDTVRAEVVGPTRPPSVQDVAAELSSAFDRPVTVQLGWIPVQTPQQEQKTTPPPPLSELAPVVEKWLAAQSLSMQGLSLESGTLVVATAGPRPPQSSAKLAAEIKEKFDQQIPISVGWTRTPEDNGPTDDETALAAARTNAANWAASRPGVAVLEVAGSAKAVSVTLIGDEKPDVSELEAELRTTLPKAIITIQWVSGGLLVNAVPTSSSSPITSAAETSNSSPKPSPTPKSSSGPTSSTATAPVMTPPR